LKSLMTLVMAALVLVGLGVMVTKNNESGRVSHSDDAIRLYEEGTRDLNAFRIVAAKVKLGQSLDLDPTYAEAAIALTQAHARLSEEHLMLASLAHADSLVTDISDQDRRMITQLRLSAYSKSKFHVMHDSLLTSLRRSDPNNLHVLVAIAGVAQGDEDDDAIERAWLDILANDPSYASAYNNLGYFELNRGDYKQAIEYMQKYSFLAPELANPHDSLGEVLMVIGRYEEAELEFHMSVKIQWDFYPSLVNLGKIYLERGEIARGVKLLEKVRKQFAGSSMEKQVDSSVVLAYLSADLDPEFANASSQFITSFPEDSFSCTLRSLVLLKRNDVSAAVSLMDSTIVAMNHHEGKLNEESRKNIASAEFQFKGLAADAVGDYASSAVSWLAAIEANPGRPTHRSRYIRFRLANALYETNRPEVALALLDDELTINQRMIKQLLLKVKCHLAMENGLDARTALDQLQWSMTKADLDYPMRSLANDLEALVSAIAIND